MHRPERINLNFYNEKKTITRIRVKISQKLKKAMRFYCKEIIKKPLENVCFFHKDRELSLNDSAESARLVDSDTIVVFDKNVHSKCTHFDVYVLFPVHAQVTVFHCISLYQPSLYLF